MTTTQAMVVMVGGGGVTQAEHTDRESDSGQRKMVVGKREREKRERERHLAYFVLEHTDSCRTVHFLFVKRNEMTHKRVKTNIANRSKESTARLTSKCQMPEIRHMDMFWTCCAF